jgi:hypothetical protein
VQFEWKKWIAFLDRYGLRGDAEFTDGKIYHSAIFDDHDDNAGTYMARREVAAWREVTQQPAG